jgi:hypothetical protein
MRVGEPLAQGSPLIRRLAKNDKRQQRNGDNKQQRVYDDSAREHDSEYQKVRLCGTPTKISEKQELRVKKKCKGRRRGEKPMEGMECMDQILSGCCRTNNLAEGSRYPGYPVTPRLKCSGGGTNVRPL